MTDFQGDDDVLQYEQYKPKPKPAPERPKRQPEPINRLGSVQPVVIERAPSPILRGGALRATRNAPNSAAEADDQATLRRSVAANPGSSSYEYEHEDMLPPPPPPPPLYGRAYRQPRRPGYALLMIAIAAITVTMTISLIGLVSVRLATRPPGVDGDPAGANETQVAALPVLPTFDAPTPTLGVNIEPWDGKERFTVLLLGLDKRPFQNGTAFRTDSMILVSLDPRTRTIGMLSVPRDLYIEIPSDTIVNNYYGLQRVNTAYFIGETVKPGYGPKLAMQTVQHNLGIRVNDYVVYDFEAVIAAIDAIGGITIDVPRDIIDNAYPDLNTNGYDPLYIRAGRQVMDGALALKYARTRHGTSDIDRALRQQQVILAARERILSANILPDLLIRAPGLWAQLGGHLSSGLTLDQLLRLAVYAKDIPPENIRTGVIDFKYVDSIMWNGAAVLVPNRAAIGPLLVQVFGPNYNQ